MAVASAQHRQSRSVQTNYSGCNLLKRAQSLGDNTLKHKTVRSPSFFICGNCFSSDGFAREVKNLNFRGFSCPPMAADVA